MLNTTPPVSETPIPAPTAPIKVGVIGMGFMGRTHAELYRRSGKAVVAAIADADPARLEPGAEGRGGNLALQADSADPLPPGPDPRGYTDGLALIENEDLDLVDICLPVHLHRDLVRAALEAGRHVMCEKPLTRYDFGDGSLIMAEGGWTAAGSMPFDMQFQMISEQATVRFDGDIETPDVTHPVGPTGWHVELDHAIHPSSGAVDGSHS